VDDARCIGSIRAAAATWVPPSVASKDFLMLFKATNDDLKTSVHGDFDYDVRVLKLVNLATAVVDEVGAFWG
ncbi:hypothetical protein Tco_1423821, partial [Tanacetum coccineum]